MSATIPDFIRAGFTARMQAELAAPENLAKNSDVGGWAGWQPNRFQLMHEMRMHILKLDLAMQAASKATATDADRDLVSHHAADMANYAMKISETHGNS